MLAHPKILILADKLDSVENEAEFLAPFSPEVRILATGGEDESILGLKADVVLNTAFALNGNAVEEMRRCRLLVNCDRGTANVARAAERGIRIMNVRPYEPAEVADHFMEMVFALWLGILPAGAWRPWENPARDARTEIPSLRGMRLGIYGCEEVLCELVDRTLNLGFQVLVHSGRKVPPRDEVTIVPFETLLRESDFLILHSSPSRPGKVAFGEREFRMMGPQARLVHGAEPSLVDEEALARALAEGWIGGAALSMPILDPMRLLQRFPRTGNVLFSSCAYADGLLRRSQRSVREFAAQAVLRDLGVAAASRA